MALILAKSFSYVCSIPRCLSLLLSNLPSLSGYRQQKSACLATCSHHQCGTLVSSVIFKCILYKCFCRARQQGGQMSQMVSHDMLSSSSSSGDLVRQQHQQEEGTSWQYDPNEPRYCLCNDVSYGEMVGCDNNDVSIHTSLYVIYIWLCRSNL